MDEEVCCMKISSFLVVGFLALGLPSPLRAQVEGLRVEGGVVFLTHAGDFTFGTSEIESDAGYAFRGRVRYGFGFVSVAAEFQESSQNYGNAAVPSAPQNLNTSFIGATAALHPFKFAGIAPYAEIGVGKLFFGDQSISTDQGSIASVYGLGVGIGLSSKVGLDVNLRLVRLGNLTAQGLGPSFDYDPKEFGLLLSIKL
jgi:hypothetical protein